ncbi:MAG: ABC transporter ATP-binding protein [Clostridia bacterium]|nr:ABC transporter ATP-binding protein [Clostridia bacterium]
MEEILKIDNLNFEYPDAAVLRDVSFTLNKGDFLGIIGANGAGKSTLIKLILKLLPLQKGSITLFGEDLNTFKDIRRVGYVSQKANAFNKSFPATVGEVVIANLYGKKRLLSRYTKEDKARVRAALEQVGMADFETRQVGPLSGGQVQRVFIARALIAEPELLLLDEPTAGVDAANANAINDILTNLNKQGMTIIMTNHNTPELVKVATKLLIFCEHGNGEFVSKNNLTLEEVNDIFAGRRKHHHK